MKQLPLAFLLVLGLSACQDSDNAAQAVLAPKSGNGVALKTAAYRDPEKELYRIDTIEQNESYLVLGDSSKRLAAENMFVMLKFKPYITFDDVPARLESLAKRAAIRYSSHMLAQQFRTVITEKYNEEKLNFGGHYCFAYWGCGSNCQLSVLVDLKTGIVYEGPVSGSGYVFRKGSRLLIANPPDSAGFYNRHNRDEPRVYVWNENLKVFEERQ